MKLKKTSIIIKIEPATATKNPTSHAIIDLITHFPHTKCILLQNGTYNINYSEEIEIHKNLFAKIINNSKYQPDVVYKTPDGSPELNKPTSGKNSNSTSSLNDSSSNHFEGPNEQGFGFILKILII